MSNYSNKTDAELNDSIKFHERDVNKMRNKMRIFGKVLGEDNVDNVIAMIQAMYDDSCTYSWYASELDELYEELERRKNDNAESD